MQKTGASNNLKLFKIAKHKNWCLPHRDSAETLLFWIWKFYQIQIHSCSNKPRDTKFLFTEKTVQCKTAFFWETVYYFFKIRVLQVFLEPIQLHNLQGVGLNGHYFSVCGRKRHVPTMGSNYFWKSFSISCIYMRYFYFFDTDIVRLFTIAAWKWTNANPMKNFSRAATASKL